MSEKQFFIICTVFIVFGMWNLLLSLLIYAIYKDCSDLKEELHKWYVISPDFKLLESRHESIESKYDRLHYVFRQLMDYLKIVYVDPDKSGHFEKQVAKKEQENRNDR
jgi:hypothetical protein